MPDSPDAPGRAEIERKKDLTRKYALGLEQIWARLVDQGPETGDPLALFDDAVKLTEASLASLLD